MIGAIIGDVIGSVYEFCPIKSKAFPLWSSGSTFTDDSVMTVAVGRAIIRHKIQRDDLTTALVEEMQRLGRQYPLAGYGGGFRIWLMKEKPQPYNSYGNGSAMRVSACGYAAESLEDALSMAAASAKVSHNHPEGIKGAEATAAAIYMARNGASKDEIGGFICDHYYHLNATLDEIRPSYFFNETCQNTVPQAITAFLESTSFEDAIRNAISLGGDADTLAAITGSIAWAYYGYSQKPNDMILLEQEVRSKYIPEDFIVTLDAFDQIFSNQ